MKATWIFAVLAVAVVTQPALADHKFGKQVRFVGIHPIPRSEGGGMCNIEFPHVHIYAANKLEYRDHDGDNYFVGDPVAYKYEGPKYAYKGPHPIHVEAVVGGEPDTEYCYIEGPHYHYFAPPDGPEFKMVGDTYFYVSEPPQAFIEARPTYVGINATYRPLVYTRPVVEVEAPVGWIGARAEFVTPGVGVEVVTPGVVVAPTAVIVEGKHHKHDAVIVGAPGVVVGGGVDVHVGLPPPPSVHVGIGVGIGGGAVVGGGGGAVIVAPGRHDNGRHNGWGKRH